MGGALEPAGDPPATQRADAPRTVTETPQRGRILARDGQAIVKPRAVVDVGVEVAKVRDATETARGLAELDGVEADALAKRIREAPKGRFLPVITLRRADYERVADDLDRDSRRVAEPPQIPVAADEDVRPRAARHRRAGDSRAARAIALARAGRRDRPVGASRRPTRSGSPAPPTRRVVIRERETGIAGKTLLERPGRRGRPLRTRSICASRRRPRPRSRR